MGGNQCKTESIMMDGTVQNEHLESLEIDQSETLNAVEVEDSEEVWTPQDYECKTVRQKHWGQICGPAPDDENIKSEQLKKKDSLGGTEAKNDEEDAKGLGSGAIIGIVCGCVVGVALIAALEIL